MPAHIKAALNAVSLSIPVTNGRPALGQWQGIISSSTATGRIRGACSPTSAGVPDEPKDCEKQAESRARPLRTPSTPGAKRGPRWGLMIGAVAIGLFVALTGKLLFSGKATQPSPSAGIANAAALASEHSPTLGDPGAAVHIVEFLDPACETCARCTPS